MLIVPTLCVGTHAVTLRVTQTRSVQRVVTTQSEGTIIVSHFQDQRLLCNPLHTV